GDRAGVRAAAARGDGRAGGRAQVRYGDVARGGRAREHRGVPGRDRTAVHRCGGRYVDCSPEVTSAPNRTYADLHEHLGRLDRAGLLYRIDAPVNKDTEMHPLVRWQFRGGIPEKERRAFLFTNIVDAKGRRYDIPVVVGALATNPEVYRIGMNVPTLDA